MLPGGRKSERVAVGYLVVIMLCASFRYHGDAAKLVRDCYGSNGSKALQNYMAEVYKLQYTDMPPYSKLKRIFEDQLRGRDPKRTLEWLHPKAKPAKPIKVNRSSYAMSCWDRDTPRTCQYS